VVTGVGVTVLLGDGVGEYVGEGVRLDVGVRDAVGVTDPVAVDVTVGVWLGKRVPVCVKVGNSVKVG
jgi:hypothetical protein